jgi:hypothetical protein
MWYLVTLVVSPFRSRPPFVCLVVFDDARRVFAKYVRSGSCSGEDRKETRRWRQDAGSACPENRVVSNVQLPILECCSPCLLTCSSTYTHTYLLLLPGHRRWTGAGFGFGGVRYCRSGMLQARNNEGQRGVHEALVGCSWLIDQIPQAAPLPNARQAPEIRLALD